MQQVVGALSSSSCFPLGRAGPPVRLPL